MEGGLVETQLPLVKQGVVEEEEKELLDQLELLIKVTQEEELAMEMQVLVVQLLLTALVEEAVVQERPVLV